MKIIYFLFTNYIHLKFFNNIRFFYKIFNKLAYLFNNSMFNNKIFDFKILN